MGPALFGRYHGTQSPIQRLCEAANRRWASPEAIAVLHGVSTQFGLSQSELLS